LSGYWPDQEQSAELKQGEVHKIEFIKTGTRRIFMKRQTNMQQALLYNKGVVVGDYSMCLQKNCI
jgi:hypothetical protein